MGSAERSRRSRRDWVVDICFFVFAAAFSWLAAIPQASGGWLVADQVVGALACCGLWLRRRWPVGVALALVGLGAVSEFAAGPEVVALFTVAVHRPVRTIAFVGGLALASCPVYAALRPDPSTPFGAATLIGVVVTLAITGWGMFVRSRRQLVLSLRERARRAEAEAELRAERAQRLTREQIAREMHDVLAHRLSLLSVHAGALEYHPGAAPEEIARAAGVIRSSAHQALQDLREVIGVLRAPAGEGEEDGDRPQPTLGELSRLVEESRQAGMRVTLREQVDEPGAVPGVAGRTAYRIVQEALTNCRKHVPGAAADVAVSGAPGTGLTVEVRNAVPAEGAGAEARAEIPGAGRGLLGLAERAALAGGRLEHGPTGTGDFRLYAWLPWPA